MSDLAAALDIIGSRWALLIVERLLEGPQRYGDLQRDLGTPTNMLATRLRELEAAGVLTRLPLRHNTRAYALTDRGLALARGNRLHSDAGVPKGVSRQRAGRGARARVWPGLAWSGPRASLAHHLGRREAGQMTLSHDCLRLALCLRIGSPWE